MRKRIEQGGLVAQAVVGTHAVFFGIRPGRGCASGMPGVCPAPGRPHRKRSLLDCRIQDFPLGRPEPDPDDHLHVRQAPGTVNVVGGDYSAKPAHDYTYKIVPVYGTPASTGTRRRQVGQPRPGHQRSRHVECTASTSTAASPPARRTPPSSGDRRRPAAGQTGRGHDLAFPRPARGAPARSSPRTLHRDWSCAPRPTSSPNPLSWPRSLRHKRWAPTCRSSTTTSPATSKAPQQQGNRRRRTSTRASSSRGSTRPSPITSSSSARPARTTAPSPAQQLWTGSTNMSQGGIFGHSNVGHAVRDPPSPPPTSATGPQLVRRPHRAIPSRHGSPPTVPSKPTQSPAPGIHTLFSPRTTCSRSTGTPPASPTAPRPPTSHCRSAWTTSTSSPPSPPWQQRTTPLRHAQHARQPPGPGPRPRDPSRRRVAEGGPDILSRWAKETLTGFNAARRLPPHEDPAGRRPRGNANYRLRVGQLL